MKRASQAKTPAVKDAGYDFNHAVQGKHFREYWKGSNVVLLTKENAKRYPTQEAVNQALAAFSRLSVAGGRGTKVASAR